MFFSSSNFDPELTNAFGTEDTSKLNCSIVVMTRCSVPWPTRATRRCSASVLRIKWPNISVVFMNAQITSQTIGGDATILLFTGEPASNVQILIGQNSNLQVYSNLGMSYLLSFTMCDTIDLLSVNIAASTLSSCQRPRIATCSLHLTSTLSNSVIAIHKEARDRDLRRARDRVQPRECDGQQAHRAPQCRRRQLDQSRQRRRGHLFLLNLTSQLKVTVSSGSTLNRHVQRRGSDGSYLALQPMSQCQRHRRLQHADTYSTYNTTYVSPSRPPSHRVHVSIAHTDVSAFTTAGSAYVAYFKGNFVSSTFVFLNCSVVAHYTNFRPMRRTSTSLASPISTTTSR